MLVCLRPKQFEMRILGSLLVLFPLLLFDLAEAGQIPFQTNSHPIHKTFVTSHPAVLRPSRQDASFVEESTSPRAPFSPLSFLNYRRPYPFLQMEPARLYALSGIRLKAVKQKIWRPRAKGGSHAYMEARRASVRASRGIAHPPHYEPMQWDEVEVETPDVTDVETLAGLAKMTSNAYVDGSHQGSSGWYDLSSGGWNLSDSFGWQEDGIRGHVFATADNSTVVVAIKGTSAGAFVGGGGSTQINDKLNDNLLFSCCCARVDWTWSTVCDCYSGGYKCDENCVEDALINKSVYYPLATDLYNNITEAYPDAQIWLTGHSLGGSLASLLSLTFGIPCVTFEAPGDYLPAKRLHLPLPPGQDPASPYGAITHIYHNADPIPQGACTGSLSSCAVFGFALETVCHTGKVILYDTVGELGWSVDIRTHSIAQVIERILLPDWNAKSSTSSSSWWKIGWGRGKKDNGEEDDGAKKNVSRVPKAEPQSGCFDCIRWEYGDYK